MFVAAGEPVTEAELSLVERCQLAASTMSCKALITLHEAVVCVCWLLLGGLLVCYLTQPICILQYVCK